VFPGADWKIGERLTWSFSMGFGTADGVREVVLKSRFEVEFWGKHKSGTGVELLEIRIMRMVSDRSLTA
jgi:hypothetical protein